MRVAVRWGPAGLACWWLWHQGLPLWQVGYLAALAVLTIRHRWLGLVASGVGIWQHLPAAALVAAYLYSIFYLRGCRAVQDLMGLFRPPPRPVGPRLRCPHLPAPRLRQAQDALRAGAYHRALDAYLDLIADHAPATGSGAEPATSGCLAGLYTRAAAAACEAGAPLLAVVAAERAHDLLPAAPPSRSATLRVHADAVRARSWLAAGEVERASAALRQAQLGVQPSRATHQFVRLVAVQVHLAQSRAVTLDDALEDLSAAVTEQGLGRQVAAGSGTLFSRLAGFTAQTLVAKGLPGPAAQAFRSAAANHPSARVAQSLAALSWLRYAGKLPDRMGPGIREWAGYTLDALDQHLLLAGQDGDPGDGPDDDVTDAVLLLDALDEPLLTGRLLAGHLAADPAMAQAQALAILGHLERCRPRHRYVQLDPATRAAWAALRGRTIEQRRRLLGARGDVQDIANDAPDGLHRQSLALLHRLASVDSVAFGPVLTQLHEPLGKVADPRAVPTPPVPAPALRRGSPELRAPDLRWSDDTPAQVRSDPVLVAAEHARRWGVHDTGVEHLLLATLDDGACAGQLASLGAHRQMVIATIAAVLERPQSHLPPFGPTGLDPAAALVTTRAYTMAQALDEQPTGAQHVLAALAGLPGTAAAGILDELGVDREELFGRLHATALERAWTRRPWPVPAGAAMLANVTAESWHLLGQASLLAVSHGTEIIGPEEVLAAQAGDIWHARARPDDCLLLTPSDSRPAPHDGRHLPANSVTLSPRGRRMLHLAERRRISRGEPGVDGGHLTWAAAQLRSEAASTEPAAPFTPAYWDLLAVAIGRARAAGDSYLALHHLREALTPGTFGDAGRGQGRRHVETPMLALPATPRLRDLLAAAAGVGRTPVTPHTLLRLLEGSASEGTAEPC